MGCSNFTKVWRSLVKKGYRAYYPGAYNPPSFKTGDYRCFMIYLTDVSFNYHTTLSLRMLCCIFLVLFLPFHLFIHILKIF